MLQIERHKQILQLLEQKSALRVQELAKTLYTSEATVRRDLCELEKAGLLRRVYGGVTLNEAQMPLDFRRRENAAAKREIAAKAAALIADGDTVFLDSSSTAQHLLPHLARFRDLTVITNSHSVMEELCGSPHRLFSTGGRLVPRNRAYVGPVAEATLGDLMPSIAFFSSQGVGQDGEITDDSEEETSLRRVLLRRAARTVFLCDTGKLGKTHLFRVCHLSQVDEVICDGEIPAEYFVKK